MSETTLSPRIRQSLKNIAQQGQQPLTIIDEFIERTLTSFGGSDVFRMRVALLNENTLEPLLRLEGGEGLLRHEELNVPSTFQGMCAILQLEQNLKTRDHFLSSWKLIKGSEATVGILLFCLFLLKRLEVIHQISDPLLRDLTQWRDPRKKSKRIRVLLSYSSEEQREVNIIRRELCHLSEISDLIDLVQQQLFINEFLTPDAPRTALIVFASENYFHDINCMRQVLQPTAVYIFQQQYRTNFALFPIDMEHLTDGVKPVSLRGLKSGQYYLYKEHQILDEFWTYLRRSLKTFANNTQ